MMKKFFFSSPLTAAVLTALTFAACSQSDTIADGNSVNNANNAPQAVEFGTYMGQNTRSATDQLYEKGTIANKDGENIVNLTKAQFGVFAYFTGATDYDPASTTRYPNFMYNEHLQWDEGINSGSWVYSPVKYWPNGIDTDNANTPSKNAIQKEEGKLSFYAFAPYMEEGTTPTTDTKPTGVTANKVKTPKTITIGSDVKENGVVAISSNNSTSNVWVKYVMPSANAADAVDLLWGLAGKTSYDETDGTDPTLTVGTTYNINLTKQKVSEKVKFLFKHALAKVGGSTANNDETTTGDPKQCGLKVIVDVDKEEGDGQNTYFSSSFDNTKTLVTLKSVKVQDALSAKNDNGVPFNGNTETKSNLNTFGWFNIETGQWCNENGTYGQLDNNTGATYSIRADNEDDNVNNTTYTLNEKIKEVGAQKFEGADPKKKKLADGNAAWSTGNPVGVTTEATPVFANENVPALMVIPGGEATLYITVDYFVRTADPKLDAGYSEVEQTITNAVSLSNLDPNKYYTIIMHLGLTSVKFEAVVTDWTLTSDATFHENGTVTEGSNKNEKKVWLPSNVVNATPNP